MQFSLQYFDFLWFLLAVMSKFFLDFLLKLVKVFIDLTDQIVSSIDDLLLLNGDVLADIFILELAQMLALFVI